jgi:mannose-6-phosphate isomerase-like protein (cupin superfamily)
MASYTVVNLKSIEDVAPRFGLSPGLESHFARAPLGLENSGLSHFRIAPGYRLPFGHRHEQQEEVYLVVAGSARVKLDDDVVELSAWDAVRIPPGMIHSLEAAAEGAEIVAFGAPNTGNKDVEMVPGWWSEPA